jgi:predicted DNA-binding protein (UPF0251 family)
MDGVRLSVDRQFLLMMAYEELEALGLRGVTRDYSLDLLAERFEISREELDEIIEYEMPLAQATALGIASRIYDEIMKDDDES